MQMNIIKTSSIVLVALCTVQALCFTATANSDNMAVKVNNDNAVSEQFIKNQENALDDGGRIEKAIKERKKEKSNRETSNVTGIDNYGGSYINSEGKLTVLVCDEKKFVLGESADQKVKMRINVQDSVDAEKTDDYQKIVEQDTEYKSSKFTKNYIEKIYSYASANMSKLGVDSVIMSETNNIVKVGVISMDDSESIINAFLQDIADFDRDSIELFTVKPEDEYTFKSSTSFPGRRVYKVAGVSEGTCGFNAKDKNTGKYGVITAGHGVKTGEVLHNNNGTIIGNATTW